MRTFAMCMQCQVELGHPSFEPFFANYFDDGIAYIECSTGHKSAFLLQSLKFEILLESGATALIEGFTLEASASFATALERFYEFAVRVMCLASNLSNETYKEMFSEMSRQSERQLGAFLALYATQFAKAYSPNKKIGEFRNSVIHKGLIPTPEKAKEFASWVYAEIFKLYKEIKGKLDGYVQEIVSQEVQERSRKISADMPRATSTGTTFFNIVRSDNKASFKEALEAYKETQERLYGSIPYMKFLHNMVTNVNGT